MATTRTGLFPAIKKEEVYPKSEVKQRQIVKAKIKSERTPVTGILKKQNQTTDKRKSAPARLTPSSGRHVKFKSKVSEQESLREKLNTWLLAKGKTPSRCRHLMCFNAEVSAKKKQQVKLVDRTITQNLLSNQLEVLEDEERTAEIKKKLFDTSSSSTKKARRSVEKENQQTRRSIRFDDEALKKASDSSKAEYQSPMPEMIKAASTATHWTSEQVLDHLNIMLQECLALYNSGCPLDNLLPWLADIENHVPKAVTFAPYYICKAKVLSAFPHQVLNVYCEAVRNNAQPSEQLAKEMKSSLSLMLIAPPADLPPLSANIGGDLLSISALGASGVSWAASPAPSSTASGRSNTPHRHSDLSGTSVDLSNSYGYLSESGLYADSLATEDAGIDSTFSILSASTSSDALSSSFSSSKCSTPLDQQERASSRNVFTKENSDVGQGLGFCDDGAANPDSSSKPVGQHMGSTFKFAIGSTTPLLKNVAEASPIAVVTPVRRSVRLSGRPLTPGVGLRREINSVSELSETERQSMLFQTNPAITGD
ncbi:cytoskeleton-associated protein 2-like [Plakobranchus ocellatus]|uniref:Cytoskeleton-associated protein 2-like n=1 Tax=Plakobranchus ocellatus TaxID=259542 RepID=A0AAV3Y1R9_9GAST|nr:cytoskeleton-associated protein 2-like [Plakobranchus ocellatus]